MLLPCSWWMPLPYFALSSCSYFSILHCAMLVCLPWSSHLLCSMLHDVILPMSFCCICIMIILVVCIFIVCTSVMCLLSLWTPSPHLLCCSILPFHLNHHQVQTISLLPSFKFHPLLQDDRYPGSHYYHCYASCFVLSLCCATYHLFIKPPKLPWTSNLWHPS